MIYIYICKIFKYIPYLHIYIYVYMYMIYIIYICICIWFLNIYIWYICTYMTYMYIYMVYMYVLYITMHYIHIIARLWGMKSCHTFLGTVARNQALPSLSRHCHTFAPWSTSPKSVSALGSLSKRKQPGSDGVFFGYFTNI
jgi:hypothetical protein